MNPPLAIRWGVTVTACAKVLGFATTLVQSNSLGLSGFGAYGLILNTVALFSILAQASLGGAASNLVSQATSLGSERETASTIGGLLLAFLALASVTSVGFALAANQIAVYLFQSDELGSALRLAALILFLSAAIAVLEGTLLGLHEFKLRHSLSLIQAVSFFVLTVFLVPYFAVEGALVALAFATLLSAVYGCICLFSVMRKRRLPLIVRPQDCSFAKIPPLVGPMLLNSVLVIATNWLLTTNLGRSQGGLEQVGLYSIGVQARTLLLALPYLLHSTYGPLLAGSRDANRTFAVNVANSLRGSMVAYLPAAAVLAGLSEWVVLLFGREFVSAAPVLALNCLLAGILATSNLLGCILIASGSVRLTIAPNLVLAASSCLLGLFAGGKYGALGLTLALLCSHAVQCYMLARAVARLSNVGGVRTFISRISLLPLVALVTVALTSSLATSALSTAISGMLIFLAVVWSISNAPAQILRGATKRLPIFRGLAHFRI